MATRQFTRGEKHKYSLDEKVALGELCKKYKKEYDEKSVEMSKMVNWNDKTKKHANRQPHQGFLARAVREFYPDLKKLKHDDPQFAKALKFGKRCLDYVLKTENDVAEPASKKKYRQPGGGRKVVAPPVREALYDWFLDVRGSLKARLPRSLFKAQAKFLYDHWLEQQPDEIKQLELVFSNKWIKGWMTEFNVSLRNPNKRYQIKQEDRKERISEYIKNIWRVRKFFINNFGVDPPIINGDQMPLHRNESSTQKTFNVKGMETYVKENYSLSRERITAFTQISSDPKVVAKPEFVFKGKGTRTKINPPKGINYNWAPKGSYRLEQMLATISNLPNRYNMFTQKDFCIYVLDDYSVHIMPEVKAALLKRGYIYVGIGGGVTGDIQINDTDMHAPLKKKYRQLEQELMMKQLESDPKKIPQPTRDDMMRMLVESVNTLDVDFQASYKALWLTSALDGSEDYLVRESIMAMVGEDLKKFRSELMKTKSPKNIKTLAQSITPPKGVRRKNDLSTNIVPVDEGDELLDCEGDEIEAGQVIESDDEEDRAEVPVTDEPIEEERQASASSQQQTCECTSKEVSSSLIKLAPLCENEDLRKDATFVDELGDLLLQHKPSTRINPQVLNIKKQYTVARRNVKKRIQTEKSSETVETDPESENERNIFENLFG